MDPITLLRRQIAERTQKAGSGASTPGLNSSEPNSPTVTDSQNSLTSSQERRTPEILISSEKPEIQHLALDKLAQGNLLSMCT
jgi:hypothetical protein